jgi:hypothetical protein
VDTVHNWFSNCPVSCGENALSWSSSLLRAKHHTQPTRCAGTATQTIKKTSISASLCDGLRVHDNRRRGLVQPPPATQFHRLLPAERGEEEPRGTAVTA